MQQMKMNEGWMLIGGYGQVTSVDGNYRTYAGTNTTHTHTHNIEYSGRQRKKQRATGTPKFMTV